MLSYLFIINPKSGIKLNKFVERKISQKFSKTDRNFVIEYTRYRFHAKEIVMKYIKRGFENIVCVGGDGTIREIACVVVGKKNINLGIIPCGSGNGLARNLFIELDIDKSIDVVLNNKIRSIDCGIVNGDVFLSTCGTGFDAIVAHKFNKTIHMRGLVPYFLYGCLSYFKHKPKKIEIIVDNQSYFFKPMIATVSNGMQYGGGAIISPDSVIDDGFLELVLIENPGFIKTITNIHKLFNGKITKVDFVKYFKSKTFRIILPKNSIYHLDGEDFITSDGILNISVISKALNVFVP